MTAEPELASDLQRAAVEGMDGGRISNGLSEGIVVVDFGSQYSHLIARRIRELKVYSELVQPSATWDQVCQRLNPKGVILSGGPAREKDTLGVKEIGRAHV